jgi:hypothetical protein
MDFVWLALFVAAIYAAPVVAVLRRGRAVPPGVKLAVGISIATLPVIGWFVALWAAIADFPDAA